jgi:hypothetical protein
MIALLVLYTRATSFGNHAFENRAKEVIIKASAETFLFDASFL